MEANVNQVAAKHGIPRSHVDELLHGRSVANFAPTIPELEPLLTGVPNTHFVGPLLFAPLEMRPAPEWTRSERNVLVYLGAGGVALTDMVDVLADAFPAPEYSVLVAAREKSIRGTDLPYTHRNVTMAHEPGLTAALSGTDVIVARGSQNAVAACLMSGVPVVGLPGTRDSEPIYNMKTLEAHGCGIMLTGQPSADDIASAASELLGAGAALRALRLGDLVRAGGGAAEAIGVLEQAVPI